MTAALLLALLSTPPALWTDGTFSDPRVHGIDRRHDQSFEPAGALSTGDGPGIGETVQFWAQDYTDDPYFTFYLTSATCRHAGELCYIFVEDSQWGTRYDQDDVDVLAAMLEEETPSGGMGIIERETSELGPVPDEIDGDPKMYFLVLDIPDGFDPQQGGAYIAGFFSPYNQFTEEEAFLYYGGHSNEVEMMYIDCFPGDADAAAYTASHELVHLIQWGIEPFSGEDLWVIENQAQTGTFICGFPADQVGTFLDVGGVSPVGWTELEDIDLYVAGYGAGYLFFSWLYERFGGADFIHASLRAAAEGLPGVEEALEQASGAPVDMQALLEDWLLAVWIDDVSVGDGRWGWQSFRLSDYDEGSPGSRPGMDWRAVVDSPDFQDPEHGLGSYTVQGYGLEASGFDGSFRAWASGMGVLGAWYRESGSSAPQRIETGWGKDVAVPLPATGEVLLACTSFFGLSAAASAGTAGAAPGGSPAVYPQPCLGVLHFSFVSDGSPLTVAVFDQTGRYVESFTRGSPPAGETVVSHDASDLATGVYMYRFEQGGVVSTGRFTVVR
jgi:hypothetical protein